MRPLSVCLSVCDVSVLWPNGWMDQDETWRVGRPGVQVGLVPGHIVLDGDPAPPPKSGWSPPIFGIVYCGQMAGWIKMPLGREVGPSQSNLVLGGDPAPSPKGSRTPSFPPMSIGQTGEWIQMPLGMEVRLGPGHIV